MRLRPGSGAESRGFGTPLAPGPSPLPGRSLIRFCGSFIATRAWIMGPEPDERKQDRQGARAESGSRRAPAERADEPLSERAGHEDAGAHPRERDADRAPAPLGEPARQEHPHRYRAQADEPNGAEEAGVEIELPGASDRRGQERGGGQEADPGEDHAPRAQSIDEQARDG